jgi:hypothetical protein
MNMWWIIWLAFMVLFLLTPVGYGWGYRQWGPPYPRYIQHRRAAAAGGTSTYNHHAWGWRGDLVWMALFIGLFWAAAAFWWRR